MYAYDIISTVDFLPTTKGGRESPTPSTRIGYIFVHGGAMYDCYLMLDGTPPINPGDQATVPIKFLDTTVKSKLNIGDKFELRDYRTVATGIVTTLPAPQKA